MNIIIKGKKQLKVDPNLHRYIEERINKYSEIVPSSTVGITSDII
jgi:ribosome-associated translation inhibitor RaiA